MLSIIKEIRDYDLKDELWSGGLDTLRTVIDHDRLYDLISLLEDLYPEPVDINTINYLLWYDDNYIFEKLGIKIYDVDSYARIV